VAVTDKEAIAGLKMLAHLEGIIRRLKRRMPSLI
jgi:tryptophan synthase beta subunit